MTDTQVTEAERQREVSAREAVGQTGARVAPQAALSTPPTVVAPKRGLSDATTVAPSADAATVAPTVADTTAPTESPAEVATRVNGLAETDPVAAATELADAIEENPDPAFRSEVVAQSQPALDTIGQASVAEEGVVDPAVQQLSRASEALHAGGQSADAEALADGFAGGVDTASRELAEQHNIPVGAPALQDAFENQVASGNGANFAADVTSSFAERAGAAVKADFSSFEAQRLQNLTANAAGGLSSGLEGLRDRVESQGREISERMGRVEEADERFGPELSPAERDAANTATADETARALGEYEQSSAQLHDGLAAATRAWDSVHQAQDGNPHVLSTAANDLGFHIDRAVQMMPAASATLQGQAAMADTLKAQAAGERTWLDTVATMRESGLSDDASRAAFASAASGGALLGATDLAQGGSLDGARDAIARNASGLLDERGQAAVDEALSRMDAAGDTADGFTAFADSLEQNEDALGGPQVSQALGALGTVAGKPELISGSPAFQRYARGAGVLASAAGLALSGPGDNLRDNVSFGLAAANTAVDAVEVLARPGSGLAGWAGVAGRVLGGAGAALSIGAAIQDGDALGVASGGLALYGALAANPYAAVAAGLIQGGRFLWDVRQENIAQNDVNAEYLRGAGLSAENADFVGGIGNYGPPLLGEHGQQHSGIDDIDARLDAYRNGDLDYFVPLELWQMNQ